APYAEVWYATDAGQRAIFAQRPDGKPTYRLVNASDLNAQYYSYNAGVWDSVSNSYLSGSREDVGSTIIVRWGASLPAKPYVVYSSNANGFDLGGNGPSSSYVTIRGFTFRCHGRTGITIDPPTNTTDAKAVHHIDIIDNKIFYDGHTFRSGP